MHSYEWTIQFWIKIIKWQGADLQIISIPFDSESIILQRKNELQILQILVLNFEIDINLNEWLYFEIQNGKFIKVNSELCDQIPFLHNAAFLGDISIPNHLGNELKAKIREFKLFNSFVFEFKNDYYKFR